MATIILTVFPTFAGPKEETYLKEIEQQIYPEYVTLKARMTIFRPGKEYRKLIKIYIKGYEKSLLEFIEPPQELGTRALMVEDNMWLYLPWVGKVIRLSGRTNVVGGEFIYDDILRPKFTLDYAADSIGEEKGETVLTLKAKNKTAAYSQIKLYAALDTHQPVRSEFYTASGLLLKQLIYSNPRAFKGKMIPSNLSMQLAVSKDYRTEMEIIEYDTRPIPTRIFTQEYLKKGL